MNKKIVYFKQLSAAEVGDTNTHEKYIRFPNNFDTDDFFGVALSDNDSVKEHFFTATNLSSANGNEKVQLRFVYYHQSASHEKRIPSLGDFFDSNDVVASDVVRLECSIVGGVRTFTIRFYKASEISLNATQVLLSMPIDEPASKPVAALKIKSPLQQIFYGAPGTGKSYRVKEMTSAAEDDKRVFRTTFHPDSDYSTFVGAYKPTMEKRDRYDIYQKKVMDGNGKPVQEKHITYQFVAQAFLHAYVKAWTEFANSVDENTLMPVPENPKPVYLVIEEINRGNCAQIFGDLFQLLDRNDEGFSDYAVVADNDLGKFLNEIFAETKVVDKLKILGYENVASGRELVLPPNLSILATMNTSDQSLFPIDSAFKRRWDWEYVSIHDVGLGYKIEIGGEQYDWWKFLEAVNERIAKTTGSEDKQLGYFFCKAVDGVISEKRFVSKVLFYVWNDVFKDYDFSDDAFYSGVTDESGAEKKIAFKDLYESGGCGLVNEAAVKKFLENLGVEKNVDEEPEKGNGDVHETSANLEDYSNWSQSEKRHYEFWSAFFSYAGKNVDYVANFGGVKSPTKDHWKNFFVGGNDFHFVICHFKDSIAAEVYFNETTETFHRLLSHKSEIEQEMNAHYDWLEIPNKKSSRIRETKKCADIDNKDSWPEIFDFCINRLLRMKEVFVKYANKEGEG